MRKAYPNSKVPGANMWPIRGLQDPGGPHVGPMNFAIWITYIHFTFFSSFSRPVADAVDHTQQQLCVENGVDQLPVLNTDYSLSLKLLFTYIHHVAIIATPRIVTQWGTMGSTEHVSNWECISNH